MAERHVFFVDHFGAVFLKHFLLAVGRDSRVQNVNFIASDSALRVMAEELDLKGRSNLVGRLTGVPAIGDGQHEGFRHRLQEPLLPPLLASSRTDSR